MRPAALAMLLSLLCAALGSAVNAEGRPRDAREGPDPELRVILLDAIQNADSFQDRFDAEVWLTDMSRRLEDQVPDPNERLEILRNVHRNAMRVHLEPEFVLAVIDVESNFDKFAISASSALGLMQVMPFWVPQLGYKDKNELFKIETNTLLGCQILRYYLDMERGDMQRALARYNGSLGKKSDYADNVLRAWRVRWSLGRGSAPSARTVPVRYLGEP